MHLKGHLGLALLVLSLIAIPFGFGPNNYVVIIITLTAGLSSLPNIDLRLVIAHRKFTHNILFAIIAGVGFCLLFGYGSSLIWGVIGFLAGFGGVMLHLAGDIMTHMTFKPLWPFSHKEVALHWFKASNETVNNGFMTTGFIVFVFYLIVSSGALESLL